MEASKGVSLLVFTACCLLGQSVTPPAFEVTSIKRNPAGVGPGGLMRESPAGINYIQAQLRDLMCRAYGLQPAQIEGGPGWINSETYDISATVTPPDPQYARRRLMLQTLLEERFKLAIHREQKELPVYALVVGANGPKLREAEGPNSPDTTYDKAGTHLRGKMSAQVLAGYLAAHMGQRVLNETGLKGTFDIALDFTLDDRPQTGDESAPSVFTAVKEQLGLKLEARKAPVETVVIDHVEKPTEN